jgi:hypothetical protein
MKKYIAGQELLRSTTINSHDLADLILNEKIQAFYPENHTSVFDDLLDHWKEIVTDHKKQGIYLISKSVNKLDQTVASELKAFQEQVIPWLIEQIPELLFLIDEAELIQKEFPRSSSNEPTETIFEPGTKLHAHEVKKHWGIDKLKLAEYVWEKGLPAFDQYERRIPTVEMVVVLNSFDLKNDLEKQKEFIADQITYFISDDVLNFEYDHGIKPAQAAPVKENTPAPQTNLLSKAEAEAFIRSMAISYLSDTEVIIKAKNKEVTASREDMGFKASSKPWAMFIKILQDKNHEYHVGIYDNNKNPENLRAYNREIKLFPNFGKKFVAYINNQFSVTLPNIDVFKNMKGIEHAGTYKPEFQIYKHKELRQQKDIKSLSQKNTIEILHDLSKQLKREKNETEKKRLLNEIRNYGEHAKRKGWITKNHEMWDLIAPLDDTPSENDMMELISEVTDKDKYRLF